MAQKPSCFVECDKAIAVVSKEPPRDGLEAFLAKNFALLLSLISVVTFIIYTVGEAAKSASGFGL
jgi:hypothetical protein